MFTLQLLLTHFSKVVAKLPELCQFENKTHKLLGLEKIVQLQNGRVLKARMDGNLCK